MESIGSGSEFRIEYRTQCENCGNVVMNARFKVYVRKTNYLNNYEFVSGIPIFSKDVIVTWT